MKRIAGWAALTIALAVAGAAFWNAGQLGRRMIAAEQQLLVMDYAAPAREFREIAESRSLAARLPWATSAATDAREASAVSAFWRGDYGTLAASTSDAEAIEDVDPSILLLSANAAFRLEKPVRGNPISVQRLERILDTYAEVLKRAPDDFTAAYNYEFVARVRDQLIRPGATRGRAPAAKPPETIHGTEGGRPDASNMSPFQTLQPLEGDERRDTEEAGKRQPRIRRG